MWNVGCTVLMPRHAVSKCNYFIGKKNVVLIIIIKITVKVTSIFKKLQNTMNLQELTRRHEVILFRNFEECMHRTQPIKAKPFLAFPPLKL